MLKRPAERKEILADLLKLNQYDELAEQAKDRARQLKGQIDLLERNLKSIEDQLQHRSQIAQEHAELELVLAEMQQQQTEDNNQLHALLQQQQQRQTWQQQLSWQQQQQRNLMQDCQRLQQELASAKQQQQELGILLQQEEAITTGYHHFQTLQTQEETQAGRLKIYQTAQTERQQYQQQQSEKLSALKSELQQAQTQLEALTQQEAEIQHVLSKSADVEAALEQLHQARAELNQLDQLQIQASPLLQRRQQIQTQLDHKHTRLATRLEELRSLAHQLQTQQEQQPQLNRAVLEIDDRIHGLEHRRIYQQQVREKGMERRSFMERLQAHQRDYEVQLADVEQKIQLLQTGVESQEVRIRGQGSGVRGQGLDGNAETRENGEMGTSVQSAICNLQSAISSDLYPLAPCAIVPLTNITGIWFWRNIGLNSRKFWIRSGRFGSSWRFRSERFRFYGRNIGS